MTAPARPNLLAVAACVTGVPVDRHPALAVTGALVALRLQELGRAPDGADTAWKAWEAWERLATRGLIPMDWVAPQGRWACHREGFRATLGDQDPGEAPARLFVEDCPTCSAMFSELPCEDCADTLVVYRGFPADLRDLVAIAADAPTVLHAEALARECAARLAPWGGDPAARVAWRVGRWHRSSLGAMPPLRALMVELDLGYPEDVSGWPDRAEQEGAWLAATGAKAAKHFGRGCAPLPGTRGGRGAWRSPFEPLGELRALGYSLERMDEHVIQLRAPEIAG